MVREPDLEAPGDLILPAELKTERYRPPMFSSVTTLATTNDVTLQDGG
jgi:hypothetical protein